MLHLTFIDDDVNDNEFDDEEEYVKEKKVVKKDLSTTSIQRVPYSSSSTALMELWQTISISLHASLSTLRE